mmetsp:Transcript_7100/g.9432  ORF Transcript_7100/g.9432 Transcript_7100/m.9432 type:complete len:106 (+) Transcript_7100:121-438(+)
MKILSSIVLSSFLNCVLADSLRASWMDQKQTKNQVSEQRFQREISAAVYTLQDPLSDEVSNTKIMSAHLLMNNTSKPFMLIDKSLSLCTNIFHLEGHSVLVAGRI